MKSKKIFILILLLSFFLISFSISKAQESSNAPAEVQIESMGLVNVKIYDTSPDNPDIPPEKRIYDVEKVEECYVGEPCGFKVSYSDPDGTESLRVFEKLILKFGDGEKYSKFGDEKKYAGNIYESIKDNGTITGYFKISHIYNRSKSFNVTLVSRDSSGNNRTVSLKVDILPADEVPESCVSIDLEGKKKTFDKILNCKCPTAPRFRTFCRCKNGTWKCKHPKEVCRKPSIKCGEPNSSSYPIAFFEVIGHSCKPGEICTFNTSGSYDPDGGEITRLKMEFGDGTNITKEEDFDEIKHTYSSSGSITVNITVTDDEGLRDTYSDIVHCGNPVAAVIEKVSSFIRKGVSQFLGLFK